MREVVIVSPAVVGLRRGEVRMPELGALAGRVAVLADDERVPADAIGQAATWEVPAAVNLAAPVFARDDIADAVARMAKGLGLTPVAEGVEDRRTAETLAAAGLDLLQGYHSGRPMPADHVPPAVAS